MRRVTETLPMTSVSESSYQCPLWRDKRRCVCVHIGTLSPVFATPKKMLIKCWVWLGWAGLGGGLDGGLDGVRRAHRYRPGLISQFIFQGKLSADHQLNYDSLVFT